MTLFFKFDFNALCQKMLEDTLDKELIKYKTIGLGEIELLEKLPQDKHDALEGALSAYHITIVEDQKSILIEKIKDTIIDMVFNEETNVNVKSSVYLAEQLGHSYGYISNLFSEVTYTSIEHFIILQKIEFAKQLVIKQDLSLTEIAFKLNYSSVAHLSTQFKKTTGITPSAFQRIIAKRKALNLEQNN